MRAPLRLMVGTGLLLPFFVTMTHGCGVEVSASGGVTDSIELASSQEQEVRLVYGHLVRGSTRSVTLTANSGDHGRYRVRYGSSPEQVDREGACRNTGYGNAFCAIAEVPADPAIGALFLWVVAPDGTLLGRDGRPYEIPLVDSVISVHPIQESPAVPIERLEVCYDGALPRDPNLRIHYGFDGWRGVQEAESDPDLRTGCFQVRAPDGARTMEFALRNQDRWDNNRGRDFSVRVRPWVSVQRFVPINGTRRVHITYQNKDLASALVHYGHDGWQDVTTAAMEAPFYFPVRYHVNLQLPAEAKVLDLVFWDGESLWDNDNHRDYRFDLDSPVLWR